MSVTNEKIRGRDFLLVVGGVLLLADAFGLDLTMPLNLAIGVPYALVVVLGLWWPGRVYIYTAAIIGSVLCLAGFYFNFTGENWEKAVIDRGLALFTIWMVAAVCLFQKRTQKKKQELQQLVHHIGQFYSAEMTPNQGGFLFSNILDSFVSFTESRIGLIGEVLENENGKPFLKKMSGVVRDSIQKKSKASIQGETFSPDLDYYNMDPLLDEVLISGKPLIMNYVSPAVTRTPLPVGLHLLESFMGLPLYHSGRLLGIVCVANREGGYENRWAENLKPLLMASSGNIHLWRNDRETQGAEKTQDDGNLDLKDTETVPEQLQAAIEEKNAHLAAKEKKETHPVEESPKKYESGRVSPGDEKSLQDQEWGRLHEKLSRVQEELEKTKETLSDKEALLARANDDRNRTAEALGEKEDQLIKVMADFNQLETDLENEKQKRGFGEEDLKLVREQLRERERQVKEIEILLLNTQNHLQEKEKRMAQIEGEMFRLESASLEKDRRYRQMDLKKNEAESQLQETKTRLSRVEGEILLTKDVLSSREEFLQKIGKEIQETFATKSANFSPPKIHPMSRRSEEQEPNEIKSRPPKEPELSAEVPVESEDFVSYEEAGQGICGLDLEGKTTFINPAGAKMLGYTTRELIGKNQHQTIHHSRINGRPYLPQECHICNTLSEGVVSHVVDEVFWRKDGSHFPVEYLSTPISKDNKRVGAVVTFTDTSHRNRDENAADAFRLDSGHRSEERKEEGQTVDPGQENKIADPENGNGDLEKMPRQFQHYAEEVERSNQDLRDFASIASHDLQEPLRKIIGFGSRLKKDCAPSLDDKGRDYLERMERAANQMQNFIDELLQYSKLNISPPSKGQRVDLGKVIADVLNVLDSRIEETQATIEVGDMPAIEADRLQMHQLFQNLISNGLKFQKSGEPPAIRIAHRRLENGGHEIRVEDQGIGFEEKHLDRIFKPFERLHGRMEYEGTGMGLAICQKIVRRHGGEITAKSSPQIGTIFIVTLPDRKVLEKDPW